MSPEIVISTLFVNALIGAVSKKVTTGFFIGCYSWLVLSAAVSYAPSIGFSTISEIQSYALTWSVIGSITLWSVQWAGQLTRIFK